MCVWLLRPFFDYGWLKPTVYLHTIWINFPFSKLKSSCYCYCYVHVTFYDLLFFRYLYHSLALCANFAVFKCNFPPMVTIEWCHLLWLFKCMFVQSTSHSMCIANSHTHTNTIHELIFIMWDCCIRGLRIWVSLSLSARVVCVFVCGNVTRMLRNLFAIDVCASNKRTNERIIHFYMLH